MKVRITLTIALAMAYNSILLAQSYQIKPTPIQTNFAKYVGPKSNQNAYPRPQLKRENWTNLNGVWQYNIVKRNSKVPDIFEKSILVPYPIESALSGVRRALQPSEELWYKKIFDISSLEKNKRVLLHFGAVDWEATVYVNGNELGSHKGGYTAFEFDITNHLRKGENELMVKVYDPTNRGYGPHGKQVLNPQNIYYTASSGIWQTVWLEKVTAEYIGRLLITPDIDKSIVNITVMSAASKPVLLNFAGKTYPGRSNSAITVPVNNAKLWSPASPHLYQFTATLGNDKVSSYFGMRKIAIAKDAKGVDRIFLNNRPYFNLGTLDQGFWPEGLYTAPNDEALAFDIKAIKAMGFNTIRKHIKVEPARWYYHADKIGMLVWQDFVNPNQGLPVGSKAEFEKESAEIMTQLHNYPSITTWVLFNEQWGSYDQKRLTEWVKAADPSRIVNGHTGEYIFIEGKEQKTGKENWVSSDMTDVHSYPDPMNAPAQPGKARIVGEFGGVGVSIADHQWNPARAWGYIQVRPEELKATYEKMTRRLKELEAEGLSGSIYTEPFDVEGEENGLMTYDRKVVKIPFAELRAIHATLNPDQGIIPDIKLEVAGSTEFDLKYKKALGDFESGKKDTAFLTSLATMAKTAGDNANANLVMGEYLKVVQAPYSKEQIEFVQLFLFDTKSNAFKFFIDHMGAINQVAGDRYAENNLGFVIFKELIEPSVSGKNPQPDWVAIEKSVTPFGAASREIFLKAKYIHHDRSKEWNEFVLTFDKYAKEFPGLVGLDLNNNAWKVFEKVTDKKLLELALGWSFRAMENDKTVPNLPVQFITGSIDTYANLLYKVGRKEEAIAFEKKALKVAKDRGLAPAEYKSFEDVIAKMEAGEVTWPVSK